MQYTYLLSYYYAKIPDIVFKIISVYYQDQLLSIKLLIAHSSLLVINQNYFSQNMIIAYSASLNDKQSQNIEYTNIYKKNMNQLITSKLQNQLYKNCIMILNQENLLLTKNLVQQNKIQQEQMINNLMVRMHEYKNIEQIKKYLVKTNQSALMSLLSNEISHINNSEQTILQNFYKKFYQKVKQIFPGIFKNEQKALQTEEMNIFIKQIEVNEVLFQKLKTMLKQYEEIEYQIKNIFEKSNQINNSKEDKNKLKNLKNMKPIKNLKKKRIDDQIKKNQVSQHAYIRLYPKTQQCMQYLMKNNKFPRLQLQINIHQPLQYLIDYLKNKWIKDKSHKILVFPDTSQFLKKYKNSSKIQPLNNLLMITDILSGYDWPANNIISLYYQIVSDSQKSQVRQVNKIKIANKKKEVLEMVQQQKYNPYSEAENTQKNLDNNHHDQSNLIVDQVSINFNDSFGLNSMFKKNYSNSNSNPFFLSGFHNSNSILEFKTKKNENPQPSFQLLRQSIKIIEGEDNKISCQDSFKNTETYKEYNVPTIKRKSFL